MYKILKLYAYKVLSILKHLNLTNKLKNNKTIKNFKN